MWKTISESLPRYEKRPISLEIYNFHLEWDTFSRQIGKSSKHA